MSKAAARNLHITSLNSGISENAVAGHEQLEVKSFIRDSFADAYEAKIAHFLPVLLSLRDTDEQIHAALGLAPAGSNDLFLEQYLDLPIEEMLSPYLDHKPCRNKIVEVGNLSIADRGASRSLIAALSAFLFQEKFQWAVFTIGPLLINSFRRLGIELIDLGAAEKHCLSVEEQLLWGNYYDHKPRVMVTSVSQTYRVMKKYHMCQSFSDTHWNSE